jgi:uncharacterized membrane protein
VVAIALTLLVLPLSELVPEILAHHGEAIEAFTHNQWKIYTFLLSFVVIARLWFTHHQIFESVRAYNGPLVYVNFLWIFTIAVLPFPTEIVGAFSTNRFAVMFYIGTILVSSLCHTAMIMIIRKDPEVRGDADPITDQRVLNSQLITGAFVLAFVVGSIWPQIGYYSLLLVWAAQWLPRWVKPRRAVAKS